MNTEPSAPTADLEIVSTREFDAPLGQVWEAWTNPELLAQWWGPKGFTNTFSQFDLRPGGHWVFVMHGPDGRDYPNESIFSEIKPEERIVFDHVCAPLFQVTASFAESAGKTRVTFRMLFEDAGTYESVKSYCIQANEENFDRFGALLTKLDEASRELVISRVIDASCEDVYRAWTTRFSEWWGPHGMTTPFVEMDLRPGGVFRTVMRAPDGTEYPTQGVFLDIEENRRIVFTDAYGPGWAPSLEPFFTAVTTLEPLLGNRTRYTARALHWTVENRRKHEAMGFYQGWGESIDRLAACVTA